MSEQFEFLDLEQPLRAEWPVKVNVPQDGGGVKVKTFTVLFELVPQEDILKIVSDPNLDRYSLHRRQIVGFGKDHTGQSFSDELLIRMLGRPYVQAALAEAYQAFSCGIAVKN